jgi:SAM-dependent methyltransferase
MYGFYKQFVSDVVTIDWGESLHVNEHLDIVADLNFVPIPETLDQSFDTIILSDVLEHIYEPQNLLRELYRILKQNGILMMNVPFYYWVHEIPHDYYRYTEYTLKRYFEELHFDIIVFERVGGLGACWNDITSKTLCRLGLPGRIVAACLTIPICLFRNTFPIKELLSAHSNNFPLGYFIVAKKV